MSAAIFNSGTVKILKDILKFKSGNQITQAGTVNPTAISTAGMPGDLYIHATTGAVYKKLDSGASVNWKELLDSATVAAIVASYIPLSQKGAANGVVPLDGGMKIDISYLPSSLLIYKGQWNALTNTPSLADASGTSGWVYETSVAGTQNLGSGSQTFKIGDWVVYDGTKWDISTNSNEVVSVNGMSGAITLTTTNINEGTNLYFTDERAQDAIGAALVNTSTVSLVYNDAANQITANVVAGSISSTQLAGNIDATKIADGTVTSTEFQYINSLTSNVQTQLDNRANTTLTNLTSTCYVSQSILPSVDANNSTPVDLGTGSARFRNIQGQTVVGEVVAAGDNFTGKFALISSSTNPAVSVDNALVSTSTGAVISGTGGDLTLGPRKELTSIYRKVNIVTTDSQFPADTTANINLITGAASVNAQRGEVSILAKQLNLNSKKIVNLLDPTTNQDAATKLYVDVKAAASGITNFITNGNAEAGVTDWFVDSFAAASRPSGALSGVATGVTFAQSATAPLAGSNSFLFSKDAVNRQGRVVYTGLTITPAYFAKVLSVSADYQVASGTFVAGTSSADSDVIFYLQDVSGGTFIEPSSFKLLSNSTTIADKFQATFQTSATSTSYRLMMYVASTSAVAYALRLDNISVSPSVYVYGSPITDWQSFTPTGTFTTSSTYTGLWRRVGSVMEVQTLISFSGAPNAANLTVSLPAGFSIDSTKIVSASGDKQVLGYGELLKSASASYPLLVDYSSSTSVRVAASNTLVAYGPNATVNATTPVALANADTVMISYEAPILGWSSSVQMSDSAEGRLIFSNYTLNTAQTLTRNAYTILNYDTKIADTAGSVATGTSWKFTAVTSGQYKVSASINIGAVVPTTYCELKIFINGVANRVITHTRTSSAYTPAYQKINGTTAIYLNAGDYIDVRAFFDHASTNSTTLNEPETGWLVIEKIASPSIIAATESITASYSMPLGQSITNNVDTVLLFTSKIDDSHGIYNTTTGDITIPTNGIWTIESQVDWSSGAINTARYLGVRTSAAVSLRFEVTYPYNASLVQLSRVTWQGRLTAGTVIRLIGNQGSGGSLSIVADLNYSQFSIRRVGN